MANTTVWTRYNTTDVLMDPDITKNANTKYGVDNNIYGAMPMNLSANNHLGLVADVGASGQMCGIGPRIMNLDGATPQVFPPAVIVMLQTPTMWKAVSKYAGMNDRVADPLGKMLKDLWELHAREISGIDFGYNLNTSDSLVGQDGQNLSVPTNTQRSAVSPSVTWTELYGNLVWNFHYRWIMDINHPDTQNSYLSAISAASTGNDEALADLPPWVMSTFSCSFMAIQPDPYGTYDRILDAALYTGCFPTETGNIGIKKQVNSHELMERSIPYKALVQHNDNTREVGALILKALNFHKPDYQRATTLGKIDGDLTGSGANRLASEAITAFKDMVAGDYILQEAGGNNLANSLSRHTRFDMSGTQHDANGRSDTGMLYYDPRVSKSPVLGDDA